MDETNGGPRRASEWLVALNEAPEDAGLRAELAAWIAESPDHARDWQEMLRTYEAIGLTEPAFESDWAAFAAGRTAREPAGVATAADSAREVRRRGVLPRALRAPKLLAALAIAACLLVVIAPAVQLRLQADHVTATAETRSVRLEDGSLVRLGPESALAVDYAADVRDVRLLRGEAFFDVAHNPARPFRVAAKGATTTVLGTAFDVRLQGEGVEVGVGRGHVRVDYAAVDPHVAEHLRAGEQLRLGWDGRVSRIVSPASEIGNRTAGELVAKDMSVAEAIDAIRPWYGGVIILRGDRLARQPTTGVYRLADPVAAVRAVAEAQGARMQRITPWILVVSAP